MESVSLPSLCFSSIDSCHFVLIIQVGLDKSATINLGPDEQSTPIPEPEPIQITPLVPVSAPKRKSSEKPQTKRQTKQRKISEYLAPPNGVQKQAQKRKTNSNSNAKKVKSSQDECERQMALMENDGIGVVDLTENADQPELDDSCNRTMENNQVGDRPQGTVDFLQKFKMPAKGVFKFVQPSKTLQNSSQVNRKDSSPSAKDTVGESDDILFNPVNSVPAAIDLPRTQLLSTRNHEGKSLEESMINNRRQEGESNENDRPMDAQRNTKCLEEEPTPIDRNDDNKNVYVCSRIKATLRSQTHHNHHTIRRSIQPEKIVPRKKDINFRYDIRYHHNDPFYI